MVRLARRRSGVALVAALGLMMLAAALLAVTAVASRGLERAARTLDAGERAESELRRGLGLALQDWQPALDSMPVGAAIDRVAATAVLDGAMVRVRTRVRRLGVVLYAATVRVQIGDTLAPVAVRGARLLVGRGPDGTASGAAPTVRPLTRWTMTDLP